MVQQNKLHGLSDSWRALSGQSKTDGWRTIPIETSGNSRLMAGRYYPGDMEAILVGFNSINVPSRKNLPQGFGFKVDKIDKNIVAGSRIWLSLARQPAGNFDMFVMMAEDIVSIIHQNDDSSEEKILEIFLGRIRAWKNFMDHGASGVLSTEAEIGLFGELIVLKDMLQDSLFRASSLSAWRGPLGGAQDFLIGMGGIEVKSTISVGSFPAKISSLEQLDNSLVQPLFVAGVRLIVSDSGELLPELADKLRSYFSDDSTALNLYDCLLIQAGLLPAFVDRYVRRFSHADTSLYKINDDFPRLTRGNVPGEITSAVYQVDLSLIKKTTFEIAEVLETLRDC